MKAKDIMVLNAITVGPEATVRQAANILFQNRISALPVVDEHGRLVGMVSEGDASSWRPTIAALGGWGYLPARAKRTLQSNT
jgi:CBS-domain-containing membrane protein